MKVIKLKRLSISDWKGQSRVVDFPIGDAAIVGRNGSGKTTIYKAFCWLLTGCTDAENVKNHELYDNRVEVSTETKPAVVSATLEVDGMEHELSRSAKPKFESAGDGTFVRSSSDAYTYTYDDIKLTKAKYDALVSQLFNNSKYIDYILMGARFANLSVEDKVKARSILSEMIGGIDNANMGEKYPELANALRDQDINVFIDLKKKRIKALYKDIEGWNSQISTRKQVIDSMPTYDVDVIQKRIEELDKEIEAAKNTQDNEDEISMRLSDLKLRFNREKDAYNKMQNDLIADIKLRLYKVDSLNNKLTKAYKEAVNAQNFNKNELELKRKELQAQEQRRANLLKDRDDEMAVEFDSFTCPYCGQPLPEEQLETKKADFQRRQRETIQEIVTKGKLTAARIAALKSEIESLQSQIDAPIPEPQLHSREDIITELTKAQEEAVPFEETDRGESLLAEMNAIDSSRAVDTSSLVNARLEKIKELTNQQYQLRDNIKDANTRASYEKQVSDLQKTVRMIAHDVSVEQQLLDMALSWQIEAFSAVEEKINSMIDGYRIVLYSKTRDGEIKPDCVLTTLDGVRYATMNNANRIKATIALQDMFARYADVSAPMFVDEASIFDKDNLPKSNGQTILLYASNDDLSIKKL